MKHNPRSLTAIDRDIGALILTLRKDRGMTREQLAEGLGVSYQQVCKYERAESRVAASRLVAIAGLLGVKPVDLLPAAG